MNLVTSLASSTLNNKKNYLYYSSLYVANKNLYEFNQKPPRQFLIEGENENIAHAFRWVGNFLN